MRPSAAACSFSIGWDVGGWNCDKNGKSHDDARVCAVVAHVFATQRGALENPDGTVPSSEGWIWVPNHT
jgi:hypothetical protein